MKQNKILKAVKAVIVFICTTQLLIGCSAVPKPQAEIEDDNHFANFAAEKDAPLITPLSPEIKLEAGSNFVLLCEANEPIIWRALTPGLELHYAPFNTTHIKTNFGSMLYLLNITAEYVGYFYCIKQNELIEDGDFDALVENFKASKIYVYVNDLNTLLMPMSFHFISAKQYDDIVIPCKPTMPDIVIELITPDQEVYSSETSSRYDPKRGFVAQIQSITEEGLYACKPQKPSAFNKEEEVNILVHFIGNESNEPKTTHVARPQIHSDFHGHAIEGESFSLTCSVEISNDVHFLMKWDSPTEKDIQDDGRVRRINPIIEESPKSRQEKGILVVTNAQKNDSGNYNCFVQDNSGNSAQTSYLMTILKSGESYINISEPNNFYKITVHNESKAMMNANYKGFPTPTFTWFAPGQKPIQPSTKYEVTRTNSSIALSINDVDISDSGEYTLKANNGVDKELKFTCHIKGKPQVTIENVYVQAGEHARLLCKALAYPMANITWDYTACNISPSWPSCENEETVISSIRNSSQDSDIELKDQLIFKPDRPGRMQCTAVNEMGISSNTAYVLIGDIADNMTVYGVDENILIAKGDEVIITCAALAYYYSADLDWFRQGHMITDGNGTEVKSYSSDYSYKKVIKFKNIEDYHAGSYECRARRVNNQSESDSKFLEIVVHEPEKPVLVETNLGKPLKRGLGESLELVCKSRGIPKAIISWRKNDQPLNAKGNILFMEDNSILKIPFIRPNDEGLYKCVASNRLGDDYSSSQVKITNLPGLKLGWIVGIIIFIAILIIYIFFLGIRNRKKREILRQMELAGLANFEEGALGQINPAMSLDEQADLLPYDRRFEFPRDKLKLGKKLGAGAFGVVLKAHAEGIIPDEKETVVAVKMVKRTADNEVIKALVSELKIMVHLGQHLNVVNLLGAVTKNIAKREVMVIVEYCRYGNVQNFLLRNRKRFINQINHMTDKIDPTIVDQRFSAEDFELNRNSENDPRSLIRAGRQNSSSYLRQSDLYEFYENGCTEQTEGEDQVMLNNSVQPAWRSNYKPDSTEAMTVNTSDLVTWAFQVARGMDYLSSRKILHGDLAARNILLCEDNIVKICDFGLARSMYKNVNYKKKGEALLPIKWLALESLSDQVFSTYTDVWSFGIVLWEFFSLAQVPYPGMNADQTLYLKLKDGYRMEKPTYANKELYDIMLECWSANPESRPLFHELENKFAELLGDEITDHFKDLNEPYLKINTELMQKNDMDYLSILGPPDEMAPPPPTCVNAMILPEIRIYPSDDYLQMNSKTSSAIFSPSLQDDYIQADTPTFFEQHSPIISNNLDSPMMKNRKKEISIRPKSSDGVVQYSELSFR